MLTENDYFLCLSRLSHDLNNCLSITRSSMQLVEMEHPELKNDAMWQFSNDGINEMVNILNRFAIYRYGNKLTKASIKVDTLIDNITKTLNKPLCSSFDNNCPDFSGDLEKLTTALICILENAYESGSSDVLLSVKSMDNKTIFTITDYGDAIADNVKEQLFEPFITGKEGHHGLGLAIAKRIIEAHGGSIEYIRENDWNCFKVIL